MVRTSLLVFTAAVLLLAGIAREADAGSRRSRPLRTGQTKCYDSAGSEITCTGTGQDGELQRGEPRAYIDNGNGTIKDNRTALTWEKLSDDDSLHDKDTTYTWANAFAVKIAMLNTPPCFAGFCDWRLPSVMELQTIVDFGTTIPTVSSQFNVNCVTGCNTVACSCTAADFYWSSSTYMESPQYAWGVVCSSGVTYVNEKKYGYPVRAVRGGS